MLMNQCQRCEFIDHFDMNRQSDEDEDEDEGENENEDD
jgi:hypothetical protein